MGTGLLPLQLGGSSADLNITQNKVCSLSHCCLFANPSANYIHIHIQISQHFHLILKIAVNIAVSSTVNSTLNSAVNSAVKSIVNIVSEYLL